MIPTFTHNATPPPPFSTLFSTDLELRGRQTRNLTQHGGNFADTLALAMNDGIEQALALLGGGHYIMTAAYDDQRNGMMVLSVQVCGIEPRLIAVAARKGHQISPLIRDSHTFAICKLDPTQKLAIRKFSTEPGPEYVDPFDSFIVDELVTGSPILSRCVAAYDCEVARHFDLETDHEIFVGEVVAVRIGSVL